jgi:cytochrome c-type biogenesis protein CcmH
MRRPYNVLALLALVALMAFAAVVVPGPALAVEPDEVLADKALETRARAISKGLRCLVCQNQSIDDSNADLARDLRVLVRKRLTAGDTDAQVIAFVTDRYGDFVLLRPPFVPKTYLLWFGGPASLIIGVVAVVAHFRRRRAAGFGETAPLTDDERRRLKLLLEKEVES